MTIVSDGRPVGPADRTERRGSARPGGAFAPRSSTSRTRGRRGTPTGGAAGLRSRGRAGTREALKDSLTVALTDSLTGCGKDPEQARLVAWWAARASPEYIPKQAHGKDRCQLP